MENSGTPTKKQNCIQDSNYKSKIKQFPPKSQEKTQNSSKKTQEIGIPLTPSCRNNGQKTGLAYQSALDLHIWLDKSFLGHDLLQCHILCHVAVLGDKMDVSDDKWFVRLYCDSFLRQYF
jgi:hypothetical protein